MAVDRRRSVQQSSFFENLKKLELMAGMAEEKRMAPVNWPRVDHVIGSNERMARE